MSDCFDHLQDAWDDALFGATANGYLGEGFHEHHHLTKTCKACGKSGLKWGETPQGWRLHDGDSLHICDQYTRNKA